jgi:uncharacterized protein YkwD
VTRVRARALVRAASCMVLAIALLATGQVGVGADTTREETVPVAQPTTPGAPGPSMFCPLPTGRWWQDYSAHGCVQRLTGRDASSPLTSVELTWLNFGALPAYADVDVAAIDATLAAFETAFAARAAAERAAREAAERAAAPPTPRRTAPVTRVVQPVPTVEQLEQMMAECGVSPSYTGYLGEHPCIAAAWERIVATMPRVETPSGPGAPPIGADWHGVMLAAVNSERAASGARPVTSCPSLTRTAQAYAEVLRNMGNLSHTGPDGSTPFDRAVIGGYSIRIEMSPGVYMVDGMVSENLAAGSTSVQQAMTQWMNSSGHRRNLLGGQWTHAGFGLAQASSRSDTYGYYWVQLFGDGTGNC